ncbi:MAG: hypothetical protein NWE78_04200 [Candidatus Bathyarchaeota archaeon]|nr:hypothetical protein [Candidatus Bathyarchaeota archaeon]
MSTTTNLHRNFRIHKRGISNVIVMVLSLVILVIIVSNIIFWSYQMNQLDWERIQEDLNIVSADPISHSSWSTATQEYIPHIGTREFGTYLDTQSVNDTFETFTEGLATFSYNHTFKASNVRVSTTSGTPVNDLEARLTIALDRDSSVFIIYNAGNKASSTEDVAGKGCIINVDGEDKAISWQSPVAADSANSVTVVLAVYLPKGLHTIQGRFFANRPAYTVGIDTRQIVAYWFPEVVAKYVRSTVATSTTSSFPVNDEEAVISIDLEEDSVTLIMYNVGNKLGSDEPQEGKGVTINIDGSDISAKQMQAGYGFKDANSVTIVHTSILTAGSHSIRGRFFSNSGQKTTIDERQFIVFSFPRDFVTFQFKESTNSVSTSSGTPANDSEALLSATLTTPVDNLIVYIGSNQHGASECKEGKEILISVDGTDELNSSSWQSPQARDYANSVTSLWDEQLMTGTHSIQGKFASNNPTSSSPTVTISNHQLLILSFPSLTSKFKLEIRGLFNIDTTIHLLDRIQTVEIQLRHRTSGPGEKWYLRAYNWSSSGFQDQGFNVTEGHLSTTDWGCYNVNLTERWQNYININGTMIVKIVDETGDVNQTSIDIDFLAIRAIIDETEFIFSNKGPTTMHLVSLWVNNQTHHQRYDIDLFLNSAETLSHITCSIILPPKPYTVKVVTNRGNMAVYSKS